MSPENMLRSFHALIITGGSSGIGKAFLEHAYRLNPDLIFFNISRSFPELKSMEGKKLKLSHFACDLADREQLDETLSLVVGAIGKQVPEGRILLINNSGFGTYDRFPKPNLARNLEMLDVNMRAPLAIVAELLPLLTGRGGAIINVASTAAFQATPYMGTYGATKAFLLNWSLALGEDLRGSGIQVLALCPGPTTTSFFKNAGMERAILPDYAGQKADQVVEAALQGLAKGRALVVSGWKNRVLTSCSALLPKAFAARVTAKVIEYYRPSNQGTPSRG